MNKQEEKQANIFISYSHRDKEFADSLESHLSLLRRENVINTWHDQSISAGASWSHAIDTHLKASNIIILLVSADFLASDYCYGFEMKQALAMHDAGEAVVIPIIVRSCDWRSAPFSKLQSLPRDAKPISLHPDQDEVFVEIAHELRRIALSVEPSKDLQAEQTIEIRIDTDFDSFSEEKQKDFLAAIKKLLGKKNLDIIDRKKGSVLLKLKLTRAEVERLQRAAQDGELGSYDVVEAEVVVDEVQEESLVSNSQRRPRIFIGSSTEGLDVAETIQLNLDHLCEVTIWSQGVFTLGRGTLETLANNIDKFDYAILVLTPDDFTESRGDSMFSPRDNVIFELGLFMGFLGRDRTIIVYDRTSSLKIPSDLAGVTTATYQPHSSGNIDAALGAPCTRLKKHIQMLGLRVT